MDIVTVATVLLTLISLVYALFKYKFSYWSRKNVPFLKPRIPFGNIQGFGKRVHSSQLMHRFYKQMKGTGPICGMYFFTSPFALVTDLDFVKNVLIKDFNCFHDRGMFFNEKDDPLSAHLFSVEGQRWKGLRSKLTPTFSSGKMKFMFPTIVAVAEQFELCLSDLIEENNVLEMKDLLARFTTDVIGTCAFGINCNSLNDPNAEFRRMGKKVFGAPRNPPIVSFFMGSFKNAAKALRMKTLHDDVSAFFMGIVRETIEYREKNNIQRNDFMDLLMQIKNQGSLDGDSMGEITINEIAAQAFVFFIAGFETSSTTMSYCLYELALNVDIQNKARQEIEHVLKKHDGKFTYDAMMEMQYIDCIINESLRKYPPGASLIRMATKDYTIPDTEITLDKGSMVLIPVYAIHHDPDQYPDPEKFDPDRFLPEAVKKRHQMSFLPFGEGPRNCIGLRFGMMQARIGLVTLLKNFQFSTCSKTITPLVFSSKNIVLTAEGGLWLKFQKIASN